MEALFFSLFLFSVMIFPVIGAAIADDRGYHWCLGAAIGLFGGILGILILLVIPRQETAPEQSPSQPERTARPEADQERFNRPHWEP